MSSDYKLAIKIAGELDSSLSSAVKSAQAQLDSLNSGGKGKGLVQSLGSAAAGWAKTIAKASAGSLAMIAGTAAAGAKAAISVGQEFEDSMADLAGTAGITLDSEEFTAYETAAREVGATTNKTATEAAQALKYMALAGWEPTRSIEALDEMVKLSSASGMDLAQTSDMVTDSMGALGLTAEDYGRYMDFVATADSAANYSAEEFMATMIKSGGAARTLQMSYEDVAAAAGVFANNGLKGEEAGTALNSIFRQLSKSKVKDALHDAGVEVFDATGNFRGMETVLKDINTATANMSVEDKSALLNTVAGRYASQMQYLLDSVQEGGDWGTLLDQNFADVEGNLSQRYDTMTDTLTGDLDKMKSAAGDFGIEIYKSIVGDGEGGLRGAVQEVTNIIGQLKEAFATEGLSGLAQGIADAIGDVSTKIAEKAPQAIQDAQEFSSKLIKELGNTKNADAIGSAVSGIVTNLGAGFLTYTGDFAVAAGNIMLGITNALAEDDVGARIGEAASGMVTKIGNWFAENGDDFGTAAGNLISSLATELADHAGEIMSAGIDIAGGIAKGLISGAAVLITHVPQIIGSLLQAILTDGIPSLLEAGVALGHALLDGLLNIGSAIQEWWSNMWDMSQYDLPPDTAAYISDHVQEINAAVQESVQSGALEVDLNPAALEYLQLMTDGTLSLADAQAQLENYDARVGNQIGDTNFDYTDMEAAITAYKIAAQQAAEEAMASGEQMTQAASDMSAGISEETQAMVDNLNSQAKSMTQTSDVIQTEFEDMKASFNAEDLSAGALESLIAAVGAGNIDEVAAQINGALTEIQTAASTATTAVQTDFEAMGSTVSTVGNQAVSDAQATGQGIMSAFMSINLFWVGNQMMQGLRNGIIAGGHAAIAAAQQIASQIESTMRSAMQIQSPSRVMEGIGEYIPAGLAVGMENGIPDVQTATTNMAGAVTGDSFSKSMQTFNSPASAAPGQTINGGGITFAPQITITGNASQGDVQNALQWSMAEFRRMYERMMADDRRTAFA